MSKSRREFLKDVARISSGLFLGSSLFDMTYSSAESFFEENNGSKQGEKSSLLNSNTQNLDFSEIKMDKPIGHIVLDIESRFFGDITDEHYRNMDDLVKKADASLSNKYFFEDEIRIMYDSFDFTPKHTTRVSKSLERINGKYLADCDTCSFIIKNMHDVLKEKHDLGELNMVLAPGHAFLRSEERRGKANFETTIGNFYDDDYYIRKFNIPEKSIETGVYLNNLSRERMIGVAYCGVITGLYEERISKRQSNNRQSNGSTMNEQVDVRREDKLINECIDKSICLNPTDPIPYYYKGILFYEHERFDDALEQQDIALGLNANVSFFHYEKGRILQARREYESALNSYNRAIRLNYSCPQFYHKKSEVLYHLGKSEKGDDVFKKARKLYNIQDPEI